jgi:hypothetical protein
VRPPTRRSRWFCGRIECDRGRDPEQALVLVVLDFNAAVAVLRRHGNVQTVRGRDTSCRRRSRLRPVREEKRLKVGDLHIGHLLAASPPGPDGAWPCQAVREVLERVQSPWIERGMETEMFNGMGVTSRGVLDGGDRERSRAAIHREEAERFHDGWPPTAAVLHEAAERLESGARRYDDDAERRRTGFDR